MSATIYLEGGGDSKDLHARCREGFRKLFERCGFAGRMPKLVACGSRTSTLSDFETALRQAKSVTFVALLIDSEDPVQDIEQTWLHLERRDRWTRPEDATDDQVLLMTTCMETWIVSDRAALNGHYGHQLQESALPPLVNLEQRRRGDVQASLAKATRNCKNAYARGRRSFDVLGKLSPEMLARHLPSFARMQRILREKLR